MKIKINASTYHFKEDRIDRAVYIAQTCGFGEIVVKERFGIDEKGRHYKTQITDSGVLVIRTQGDAIITMYIAGKRALFDVYGEEKVPQWLMKKVENNERKGYRRNQPC